MIEFNGYISGNAERHFWKISRKYVQKLMVFAFVLLLPPFVVVATKTQKFVILGAYFLFFIWCIAVTFIPKSKKEQKSLIPKRIFTESDYIISIADKYEEARNINDVRYVRDFGEFYEIVFPFGKVSEKFICQKDLLSKGSIEEFEDLFGDKIVRMN